MNNLGIKRVMIGLCFVSSSLIATHKINTVAGIPSKETIAAIAALTIINDTDKTCRIGDGLLQEILVLPDQDIRLNNFVLTPLPFVAADQKESFVRFITMNKMHGKVALASYQEDAPFLSLDAQRKASFKKWMNQIKDDWTRIVSKISGYKELCMVIGTNSSIERNVAATWPGQSYISCYFCPKEQWDSGKIGDWFGFIIKTNVQQKLVSASGGLMQQQLVASGCFAQK